ncbi:MAG TPA: FkbM family methyltransferase [Solirubrobacteraceae bacterium]|nr:FkbM family methyltransferase [Solirubrobacteraceae bacterium]
MAGKRGEGYAPLDLLPASVIRWIGRQHSSRYLGPLIRRSSQRLRERPRTIARGQGRGLRFDPAGTHPGYALGTSEPEIQELLAANVKPGSVVWDVGANVGFLTLIAARLVGPEGRVVAFEPLPSNCEAIRRNLALNEMGNVEVVGVALSDEVGSAKLDVYRARTLAKLAGHDGEGDRGHGEGGGPAAGAGVEEGAELPAAGAGAEEGAEPGLGRVLVEQIEVPVSTFDAQLAEHPAPALVKMDVEGAEAAALRGAARLLSQVRPILLCELHGTADAVMDVLDGHDYEVATVGEPGVSPREARWYVHILATPR